jgi:hypothetical protein
MNKKEVAPIALITWLTLVAVFMLLLRRFDLQIFFVLSLIGILVIAELMQYRYIRPGYQRFLNVLIGAGIVILGAIIVRKVLEILLS